MNDQPVKAHLRFCAFILGFGEAHFFIDQGIFDQIKIPDKNNDNNLRKRILRKNIKHMQKSHYYFFLKSIYIPFFGKKACLARQRMVVKTTVNY